MRKSRKAEPRRFVYPWTKNTLPREIFKLMGPSVLAKGFKNAIFDDFSKKHKAGLLFLKTVGRKIGKKFSRDNRGA